MTPEQYFKQLAELDALIYKIDHDRNAPPGGSSGRVADRQRLVRDHGEEVKIQVMERQTAAIQSLEKTLREWIAQNAKQPTA